MTFDSWLSLTGVAQALRLLPTNLSFPLSEIFVTPYVPVPETNGEEWDRLESASALDVLVELTIHGEYNEVGDGSRTKHNLELRTVAATVFEVTKKNISFMDLISSFPKQYRILFAKKKSDWPSLKPCYHMVYNFQNLCKT